MHIIDHRVLKFGSHEKNVLHTSRKDPYVHFYVCNTTGVSFGECIRPRINAAVVNPGAERKPH